MENEIVSVIIPTFNRGYIVWNAVESALAQTYSNVEVVVVDDGSTDDTRKVLNKYSDERLKVYGQANSGISSARNFGVKKSKGKWIAFLDSDDAWVPEKLSKQIALLKKTSSSFCFSDYSVICSDGTILDRNYNSPANNEEFQTDLYNNRPPHTCTIVVNKKCLEEIGEFDISLKTAEDISMWFRLSQSFSYCYSGEKLSKIYLQQDSTINFFGNARRVEDRYRVFLQSKNWMASCNLEHVRRAALFRESLHMVRIFLREKKRKSAFVWLMESLKHKVSLNQAKYFSEIIFGEQIYTRVSAIYKGLFPNEN